MHDSVEAVIAHFPFTVRRIAQWGDCDPAGYVYTGRFPDYLLGAVRHFLRHIGFEPGSEAGQRLGIGLPCKGFSLVFHISLRPNDVVDIRINVGEIREHTFDITAAAYLADGHCAFEGVFSPICVRTAVHESTPIPSELRAALRPHLATQK
jgi:acyl-CoA thioesterase FadM